MSLVRSVTSLLVQRVSAAWAGFTGRPFGTGAPMLPTMPDATPRQYVAPFGINRLYAPRRDFGLTPFEQLEALASQYDVAALCIGARIEQFIGLPMMFVAKDKRRQNELHDQCDAAMQFWAKPDKLNDWSAWATMALYEMYVKDAQTIYVHPDRAGRLYGLDVIDGATIKPVLDDRGVVCGYQQIVYGRPETDFAREGSSVDFSPHELIYRPRFPRAKTPYGFPPTEWIILRVNQALRKQTFDMNYFTEGNIPEAFAMPPEQMQPEQLKKFEEAFNALLDGNQQQRAKLHFLPWDMKIHEFRQFSYDTKLDRWLLGITCAAYGISPQELGFVEDVNRANGEIQENINERRGLGPLKRWMKALVDGITHRPVHQLGLGLPEIEVQFGGGEAEDVLSQSQTDRQYFDMGVVSSDELRALRFGDVLDGSAPGAPTQPAQSAPLALSAPVTKAKQEPFTWSERDKREREAQKLIAAAYTAQRERIQAQIDQHGADSLTDDFWKAEHALFVQSIITIIDAIAQDGVTIGAERLTIALDWTGLNPELLRFARDYARQFAQTETDATKRTINDLVVDWAASGAPFSVFVEQVAKVWPDQRANAAAVTAVTRTFSAAQRLAWEASDVVSGYRINTANDSRVCPICQSKDRAEYVITDERDLPPLHWGCRCDIDPVVKGPDEL